MKNLLFLGTHLEADLETLMARIVHACARLMFRVFVYPSTHVCTRSSTCPQPKKMLPLLTDEARLRVYEEAIEAVVCPMVEKSKAEGVGGTPHVLTVEAGGGYLPLMAGRSGAPRVTALERSRMLYRMAKQSVEVRSRMQGHDWGCGLALNESQPCASVWVHIS